MIIYNTHEQRRTSEKIQRMDELPPDGRGNIGQLRIHRHVQQREPIEPRGEQREDRGGERDEPHTAVLQGSVPDLRGCFSRQVEKRKQCRDSLDHEQRPGHNIYLREKIRNQAKPSPRPCPASTTLFISSLKTPMSFFRSSAQPQAMSVNRLAVTTPDTQNLQKSTSRLSV